MKYYKLKPGDNKVRILPVPGMLPDYFNYIESPVVHRCATCNVVLDWVRTERKGKAVFTVYQCTNDRCVRYGRAVYKPGEQQLECTGEDSCPLCAVGLPVKDMRTVKGVLKLPFHQYWYMLLRTGHFDKLVNSYPQGAD